MQFAQKVENFFFPCSKVVRVLKVEHEEMMAEFRTVVQRAQCAVSRGGDAAAACIVGGTDESKKKIAGAK